MTEDTIMSRLIELGAPPIRRPADARSAITELKEQRAALLEGTHVKETPTGNNHACLVQRNVGGYLHTLSDLPARLLFFATGEPSRKVHAYAYGVTNSLAIWNDKESRMTSEVIDTIDTAIAYGKALEAELEELWAEELERSKPS